MKDGGKGSRNMNTELVSSSLFLLLRGENERNRLKVLPCLQGYKPTVYYPKRPTNPLFQNLVTQCEKMGIPFLYYFPSDTSLIRDSYNVIVDAIFGSSFKPPVSSEFTAILSQISRCGLPIASIDVPSGKQTAIIITLYH